MELKKSMAIIFFAVMLCLSACKNTEVSNPEVTPKSSSSTSTQTSSVSASSSTQSSIAQQSAVDSSAAVSSATETASSESSIQAPVLDGELPITPAQYQGMLGTGMDVDWAKTTQGRKFYSTQAVIDFKAAGVDHVRIRVKDKADDELFQSLDRQIADCLAQGLMPIIAYQADEFKNEPTDKNIEKVVKWWETVAERYQDKSHLLAFDLLIEATDALNKQPEKLNIIYEQLVTAIRKTNPTRIIMISPRLRSDAAYLHELTIPTNHNGYLMAEWHFYASGPAKDNDRKQWTKGTEAEKQLVLDKINLARAWQTETGVPTWVGAWMPGNYNDGDDYSIAEQVVFADFMANALAEAGIPFAVNSDTKFYDRETNQWIAEMKPVFDVIYK